MKLASTLMALGFFAISLSHAQETRGRQLNMGVGLATSRMSENLGRDTAVDAFFGLTFRQWSLIANMSVQNHQDTPSNTQITLKSRRAIVGVGHRLGKYLHAEIGAGLSLLDISLDNATYPNRTTEKDEAPTYHFMLSSTLQKTLGLYLRVTFIDKADNIALGNHLETLDIGASIRWSIPD